MWLDRGNLTDDEVHVTHLVYEVIKDCQTAVACAVMAQDPLMPPTW